MKRAASAAVLLVLLACTASRVEPEADISIAGSVERAGGVPVADSTVLLSQEGDVGDVLLAITTIGLVCIGDGPKPAICAAAKKTTTDAAGRFGYELKGRDTQGNFGQSSVLSLTTALDPKDLETKGSSTTYRFHAQTERLDLPLRIWEPSLAAVTGSFGARVAFPKLPSSLLPSAFRRASLTYAIEFTRGKEPVWRIDEAKTVTVFDPRVLEDSTGEMRVIAGANRLNLSDVLGDEVALAMRSGAREYASPLDAPASRGVGCTIPDAEGNRVAQSPCRLTDGELSEAFHPRVCGGESGCAEPTHQEAAVDLGNIGPVDFVVVRGCTQTCRVEMSPDARRWRLVGVTTDDQAAFSPAGTRGERYVRVSGPIDSLTEVSVWRDRPPLPNASLLTVPRSFPTTRPGGSGQAFGDGQGVWPFVATGLLGAVAGGLVIALVRRRGAPGMRRSG